MLGDVPLLGSFSCKLDEKGRIILPGIFEPEKGDRVVVCKSLECPESFDLYPLDLLSNKINRLDELILTSVDNSIVARALAIRKDICSLAMHQLKVDTSGRIFLGNTLLQYFDVNADRIYGLGECDKIKFFSNPDDYQKYTGRPYVKKVGGNLE